jgi:hypothetical protein
VAVGPEAGGKLGEQDRRFGEHCEGTLRVRESGDQWTGRPIGLESIACQTRFSDPR